MTTWISKILPRSNCIGTRQNDVKNEMNFLRIVKAQLVEKGGVTYIITTIRNTVLYTGVTSDIVSRIIEHKEKLTPESFSARYNVCKLVYYEAFDSIEEAISREKEIKGWIREKKIALIESKNPDWNDLFDEIKDW